MAVELGGCHQTLGLDAQSHQSKIGTCQGIRQIAEFLIGQELTITQTPAINQQPQVFVLWTATHEQKMNLVVVLKSGSSCENRDEIVAAALITGIENGEPCLQLMLPHKPVLSLGDGLDLIGIGPTGDHV